MTQKLPHVTAGKIHVRNSIEQLKLVGPRSMGVSLLTAGFVGMVFTIQVLIPACNALRILTFPTCGYCMALNPSEPRVSQSGQKRRILMYAESVAFGRAVCAGVCKAGPDTVSGRCAWAGTG